MGQKNVAQVMQQRSSSLVVQDAGAISDVPRIRVARADCHYPIDTDYLVKKLIDHYFADRGYISQRYNS
jgi:hypothetical protein